jgi:hypothetical protein
MRWSILSLLMVFASFLTAQTQYVGPDNGDWLTAANWNNGLPAAGNNATIGGGAIVVINGTLTIDFSVNNFGTIANAGTTTVSGSIIGGVLDNRAGASMTFATGSQANINNGFTNAGTFTNRGALNINTVAWSNAATGIFNNEGSVESLVTATNNGTISNKAGVFNAPQPFTNNKTIENLAGATWKVDFGGSFTNATGSSLTNAGTFQNLSAFTNNTTVSNTGSFINSGTHTCNGTFTNSGAGRFETTGTVNMAGTWNNNTGATTVNSFNFNVLANGIVNNAGTFQNNATVDISLNGSFSNEAGGVVTTGFGAAIKNAGSLLVKAASRIEGNGSITNTKTLDINGLVDLRDGSVLTNSDVVRIFGTLKVANRVDNNATFSIDGTVEIGSGGVFNNTASLTVNKPGRISNNFEVVNKLGATFINNGSVLNAVRIINEGAFTNNAYLQLTGDLMNKTTGNFNNTEVIEIRDGAIINEGAATNGKTIVVRACGIISNKSTLTNNGRIENSGVVFQRGTIAANAIVNTGGYIHTGATSNAPSICKPTVLTGTDLNGKAKVDAPAVVAKGFGIDSCFGVQYFIEYVNRRTYECINVGQTITAPVTLRFRTNDSLTCTTQVTVFDGVAPIISNCPQDVTVLNTIDSARFAWQAITAVDNCGGTPTIASTISSNSFFKVGTMEVIVTATDASANKGECRFKVTVARVNATGTCTTPDNTAPVFANCPANITLNSNTGIAAAAWNAPSVSDACYPITLRVSKSSGSLFFTGTTAVTYTATDANNNSATCTFNVTVNGPADICLTDNIKPIIRNCPPNFFGVSNAAINGAVSIWTTPSVSDNCGAVTLTSSAQSGDIFPNNTTAVTYTATDAKGNSSTCTFNVFVGVDPCAGDVAGPALTCPANVAVTTTTQTGVATWTAPSPTDACGGITLVGTHTSGSNFGLGETFVTYQASDKKGNLSTCAFKVTVTNLCFSDTTKPTFSGCPANITVQTVGTSATATWTAPTATDNCGSATVTSNFQSGATFGLGLTTIIYTATDINGNSALCQFTVTVTQNACINDVTPPAFANCPTNRPAVNATAACGATVTWTAPTASDNCGTPTVTVTSSPTVGLNSGSCFPVGTTTITYKATDAKGLTATCSFTVTVSPAQVVGFDPNKCYKIVNKVTGQVLDVKGALTDNGTQIFQWPLHGGANQQWKMALQADGKYNIVSRASGKLLDIVGSGGNCANGVRTELFPFDGTNSQKWNVVRQADGSYKLFNGTCGKPLKVEGGSLVNGAPVEIYDDFGAEYFKWFIQEIPCAPVGPCVNNGDIVVERWNNHTASNFPLVVPTTAPSVTITQGNTQGAWNIGDNYFTRVRGYIRPQVSGNYTFNITSDDFSEFFLSTNNSPSTMTRRAFIQGWTLETEYAKFPNQTTATITLQANQYYYFEMRQKEYGGGDGWRLSWKTPGATTWQPIQSQFLARPCNNVFQGLTTKETFAFDAVSDNGRAKLQWLSNTGYKNDYFVVERINAQGTFDALDKQNAYTGDAELNTYSFTDNNPLDGDNFYRINTVSNTGTPQYSEVKKVSFGKANDVNVYPNPAEEYLNIDLRSYEGKTVTLYLYNNLGKMVKKVTVEKASSVPQQVDIQEFNTGSYLVRIQSEGKRDVMKQVTVAK